MFLLDLENSNLENITKHPCLNSASTKLSDTLIKCIDKHAPLKTKKLHVHPAPYMNTKLFSKNACNIKHFKNAEHHETGRTIEKLVTKIKKQSIQNFWIYVQVDVKIKTFRRQINHLLLIKVPYAIKICFECE